MSDDKLILNGINGETGEYLLPALTVADLASVAQGKPLSEDELQELERKSKSARILDQGTVEGVDPNKLEEAGWAVVFPAARKGSETDKRNQAIREALAPLINRRREQATKLNEKFFREFTYQKGESKHKFLARLGAAPGPADPNKVPYYLLFVGAPSVIPFRVQYQVDIQYAVGRIHFETLEEYANYAQSVVAVETGEIVRPHRAAFFGVNNPDDGATRLSHRHLVNPLAKWLDTDDIGEDGNRLNGGGQRRRGWAIERIVDDQATTGRLSELLDDAPALLFTASHGLGFPNGSERQQRYQGALLCQDWGGPKSGGLERSHYFAGEDIKSEQDLRGMIGFHFACYGVGTPRKDEFARTKSKAKDQAPEEFLSQLPVRMLGHPKGGALAAIGHVDRAWGSSFVWRDHEGKGKRQLAVFQSTAKALMEGKRVGAAMEYFNVRYAEIAAGLTEAVQNAELYGESVEDKELADMWTQSNDARNYAVVGDPAVRLVPPGESADAASTERDASQRVPELVTSNQSEQTDTQAAAMSYSRPVTKEQAVDADSTQTPNDDAVVDPNVDYGWFGKDGEGGDKQPGVLQNLAAKLTSTLGAAVSNAMTLEVKTYVSNDVGKVVGGDGDLASNAEARLRAFTKTGLDGDTEVCIPLNEAGEVDQALWQVHSDMVKEAQAHRSAMIKMVMDTVSSLWK